MKCEKCGAAVPDDNKFCSDCGAPMQAATPAEPPPPVVAPGATEPAPPPPPAQAEPGKRARWWIPVVIVVAVLVVGGALAAILVVTLGGPSLTARIDTVSLKLESGGSGKVSIILIDHEGKELLTKQYSVKSSDKLQEQSYGFYMSKGSGENCKVRADVTVSSGKSKSSDSVAMTFKPVVGGNQETSSGSTDLESLRTQANDIASEAFATACEVDPGHRRDPEQGTGTGTVDQERDHRRGAAVKKGVRS